MRIFIEKQRFGSWWLYLLLLISLAAVFIGVFRMTAGFRIIEQPLFLLLIFALTSIPFIIIFGISLHTRIDSSGITAEFLPLGFTRKHFKWKEIRECRVREYSPVREYGGWGMRKNINGKKAYNIKGNIGIQIVTKDNKSFLIGTQKPEYARQAIKYYINKKDVL